MSNTAVAAKASMLFDPIAASINSPMEIGKTMGGSRFLPAGFGNEPA